MEPNSVLLVCDAQISEFACLEFPDVINSQDVSS